MASVWHPMHGAESFRFCVFPRAGERLQSRYVFCINSHDCVVGVGICFTSVTILHLFLHVCASGFSRHARRVHHGVHDFPVMAEARFIVYKRIRRRGVVCAALHTWAATLEPLLLPGWGGCTCNRMKCAGCD